jgi:hypothetical protein
MSEQFRSQLIAYLQEEISTIENSQDNSEFDNGYLGAMTNALDFVQGAEVYLDFISRKEEKTKNNYAQEYFETYNKAHAQYLNSLEEEETNA